MALRWFCCLCLAVVAAKSSGWVFEDKYACGVCLDMLASDDSAACSQYGACHLINGTHPSCDAHCGVQTVSSWFKTDTTFDLRVSKGFGTKAYGTLRVSVVTRSGQAPTFNASEFDYHERFKYKWTGNTLSTKLIEVSPGQSQIQIGSHEVQLNLPAQGAGVAGVLIGDPCVWKASITSLVTCKYAHTHQTRTRTPALLNAFVNDTATSFWGILGDNFYDRTGRTTEDIFDRISVETKSKIMLTVPGNHDYWVLGAPSVKSRFDQFGNGHMQWYPQDTKASQHILPGDRAVPFNFSVDPKTKEIPAIENSFYYNAIGNLGIIGYSGAYTLEETMPLMKEACAWLGDQHRTGVIKLGVLVGHWDIQNIGCQPEMAGPQFYEQMAKLEGCNQLDSKEQLKFVMGHTHCNIPHPHGKVGAGFMVAGQGMDGCGNYGMPIIDTTESMARIWYFNVGEKTGDDKYDEIMACLKQGSWRQCTQYATLWLNQTLQ